MEKELFMVRLVGIFFILTFTLSCNDDVPIKRLYTYPESNQISKFKNEDGNAELYVSLVSDLSEQIYPQTELRSQHSPSMMPSTLKVGGLPYLSTYLSTLKAKIEKENNVEYLSLAMGSTLPSNEQSNSKKMEIITKILPQLDLDFLQLGLRETQWALDNKSRRSPKNKKETPAWINSNIFSITTGKPLDHENSVPYFIKSVGKTFIGIMAITSYDSLPAEQKNEINGIYFQDPLTAILRTRNLLKSKNVHLNFLMYQGEINCPEKIMDGPLSFDQLKEDPCLQRKDSELTQLLSKLPPGTIDLVIAPSLNLSAGSLRGTPILGLPDSKYFMSLAKLVIDEKDHRISLKSSYILPPLKLCHYIFAGLEDCVLNASSEDINEMRFDYLENTAFGLIPSKFLGNQIQGDPKIEAILNDK